VTRPRGYGPFGNALEGAQSPPQLVGGNSPNAKSVRLGAVQVEFPLGRFILAG